MIPLVMIQARMGSTRLPGKVMALLSGKPMLNHVRDRLGGLDWEVAWPTPYNLEADVLGRFARRIEQNGPEHDPIIRVTADCPLLDPQLVVHALGLYDQGDYDIVGTSPKWDGLDVEVISRAALWWAHKQAVEPYDREHVTSWTKRHGRYLEIPLEGPALRWSVDDQEGLDFVREVFRLCEHCRTGVPHHSNASSSIGGSDRHPIWDLHHLQRGDLVECLAHAVLMSRTQEEAYVSR